MSQPKKAKNPPFLTPLRYKQLIADITRLYQNARLALAQFYWETGRLIVELEQEGSVRAPYGKGLLRRLSADLSRQLGPGFSVRNLRRMRGIYLANQKRPTSAELTWSRQVELLTVKNTSLRRRLEKKARHEGLTTRQIRALVKNELRSSHRPLVDSARRQLLEPLKGKIGIYRILKIKNKLQWDRGFESYQELSPALSRRLRAGDFVRLAEDGVLQKLPRGREADLYTYDAELLRAIDGDTLWMRLWLARFDWRKEKLRLRGIDAPELATPEGQAARRLVESLFKEAVSVTVRTTRPDKYHRYLSDIFLQMPKGEEIFLNNYLLEKGHAVRMNRIPPHDWEKD